MARFLRNPSVGRFLTGGAVLLAVLALVLAYAGRAVLSAEPFADRATEALRDPAVQADVADHLTGAVVKAKGDLVAVRPVIRAVTGAVVSTSAFAAVFHRGVLEAHAALVGQHRSKALLTVTDAAVLIQGALRRFLPAVAATIGAERVVELLTIKPPALLRDVVAVARAVWTAAWALALAALLLGGAALWLASDRARGARRLGLALTFGALALVALCLVGGAIVQQTAPSGRGPAAAAVWRALTGGLRAKALWLAVAGAVVAAAALAWEAAATGHEPGTPFHQEVATRVGRRLRTGVVPSLLAVAAGVAFVLEPGAALSVMAIGFGLVVLAVGTAGVLERIALAAPAAERSARRPLRGGWPALRYLVPVGVAMLAVTGAAVVVVSGAGAEAPPAVPATCNGYAVLCDRRLDQVVLPATHNSFASVTLPTFLFGQQDGTIADQLQFGIRGFLIDTYYGFPVGDRVRTDTGSLPKRELAVQELGEAAVTAAESIRGRLGAKASGRRQIYLCHGFCELGAVPLSSALADLRSFMVANPGEVVMIINQDEGVTPPDFARAFDQAGLSDMLYRGPLGPFPTLRYMVDSGQRLVVMAENDAGEVGWYHLAYQHALQETPFRFKSVAALTDPAKLAATCKANRGPADAPLFLVNNWVDTTPVPRPSNADAVNALNTLLHRAQTCQQIRHRLANLLAVDFYRHGAILDVARRLNGVGS